jgi:tetratricopeptide (TPR) repeat protein
LSKIKPQKLDFTSAITQLSSFKSDSIPQLENIIKMIKKNEIPLDYDLIVAIVGFFIKNEYNHFDNEIVLELEKRIKKSPDFVTLLESGIKNASSKESKIMEYMQLNYKFPSDLLVQAMQCLSRQKKPEQVEKIFEIYKKHYSPNESCFQLLIESNSNDSFKSQLWFEEYQRSNLKLNPLIYVEFSKTLIRTGHVAAGLDLLMRLLPQSGYKATAIHYNRILIELIKTNQLEDAEELYEMMTDDKPLCPADEYTTSLGLVIYSLIGKYEKSLELYQMKKKPFDNSILHYGYFGLLCLDHHNYQLALDLYLNNHFDYLPLALELIKCQKDSEKVFMKAMEIMKSLPYSRNTLNHAKIDLLVKTLFENGDLSTLLKCTRFLQSKSYFFNYSYLEKIWLKFESLGQKPGKNDINLNVILLIFDSLFTKPPRKLSITYHFNRIEKVVDYMLSIGLKPDSKIYNFVLKNLHLKKDVYGAYHWQKLMSKYLSEQELGRPEPLTNLVRFGIIEQYCKDLDLKLALEEFDKLVLEKVRPLRTTFIGLTQCAYKKDLKMVDFIFEKFMELLKQEDLPNAKYSAVKKFYFDSVLELLNNSPSSIFTGKFLVRYMLEYGIVPNNYNRVSSRLCKMEATTFRATVINEIVHARKQIEAAYEPTNLEMNARAFLFEKTTTDKYALEFYFDAEKTNYKIPSKIYPTIFQELGGKDCKEILACFEKYMNSDSPNILSVNKVLRIFIEKKDISSCFTAFRIMQSSDIKPNNESWTLMLYAFSIVAGKMDAASELLAEMEMKNITVLPEHYSFMLTGYAKEKNLEKMNHLYKKCRQNGKLNQRIIEIMVNAMAESNELALAQDYLQQLIDMNGNSLN